MKYFLLFILLFAELSANAQSNFIFTSAASRKLHDQKLRDSIILYRLQNFSDPADEAQLKGAFWAMELTLFREKFGYDQLIKIWGNVNAYSESFQKSLLEVTYTLYPTQFADPIKQLLQTTSSSPVFVRCAEYLLRASKQNKTLITQNLSRFNASEPLIQTLANRINHSKQFLSAAQLQTLFSKDLLPGETVIYSVQRANRNYPGLLLIRNAQGNFIQKEDKIFTVPQLARAITDYPFYITNGNTPQGIFKWTGFDSSTNNYIGPTTNLQMVMPFEAEPVTFFPNEKSAWSKELYATLLPSSLKDKEVLYESFYAGQIGRSEIIMHGTTINPDYYKNLSYYPNTPSMGCLCSYEEWNANGTLHTSNQLKIVEALNKLNANKGFVVVIELDDKKAPVSYSDVVKFLPKQTGKK